jgi:hypothetical protein
VSSELSKENKSKITNVKREAIEKVEEKRKGKENNNNSNVLMERSSFIECNLLLLGSTIGTKRKRIPVITGTIAQTREIYPHLSSPIKYNIIVVQITTNTFPQQKNE